MKVARASKEDIDRLWRFFQVIEEYFEYATYTPWRPVSRDDGAVTERREDSDSDDDTIHLNDEQFVEKLHELWGHRFGPAKVDAAWMRVLMNADTLLKNVADPECGHLDWKPELKALLEPDLESDRAQRVLQRLYVARDIHSTECGKYYLFRGPRGGLSADELRVIAAELDRRSEGGEPPEFAEPEFVHVTAPTYEVPRSAFNTELRRERFVIYEESDREWLEFFGFVPSYREAMAELLDKAFNRLAQGAWGLPIGMKYWSFCEPVDEAELSGVSQSCSGVSRVHNSAGDASLPEVLRNMEHLSRERDGAALPDVRWVREDCVGG